MTSIIKILGSLNYYDIPGIREDCHAIKDGEMTAMRRQAARLEAFVPNGTILIPVPGHRGRADTMRSFAKEIRRKCIQNGKVVFTSDLLRAEPHESLCLLKKDGHHPQSGEIHIMWRWNGAQKLIKAASDAGFKILLVDNVVDTGVTATACYQCTGAIPVLCVGHTDGWMNNPDIDIIERDGIKYCKKK